MKAAIIQVRVNIRQQTLDIGHTRRWLRDNLYCLILARNLSIPANVKSLYRDPNGLRFPQIFLKEPINEDGGTLAALDTRWPLDACLTTR